MQVQRTCRCDRSGGAECGKLRHDQLVHRSRLTTSNRGSSDSGPPFRGSARVNRNRNPNPNPDPRNGGPPEWRAGTVVVALVVVAACCCRCNSNNSSVVC